MDNYWGPHKFIIERFHCIWLLYIASLFIIIIIVFIIITTVCHNSCSNRGYCDRRTKQCVCSMFWLENPFKAKFGKRQSNCGMWTIIIIIPNTY